MAAQSTRRALIGGAGLAGVALIAPAIAITPQTSSIFATRLAAFHVANDRFLRTVNGPVPCVDDDLADRLCGEAGDAYRAMLATPAPDHAAVSAKLHAMTLWYEGCVMKREDFEQIAVEASALLRREA